LLFEGSTGRRFEGPETFLCLERVALALGGLPEAGGCPALPGLEAWPLLLKNLAPRARNDENAVAGGEERAEGDVEAGNGTTDGDSATGRVFIGWD
jgi:hypothetical protein